MLELSRRRLDVQDRDLQVMRFVFAFRAVTYDQIVRRHFQGTGEIVAWRRIRKLSEYGFFEIDVIRLFGKVTHVVKPLPSIWPLIKHKWTIAIDNPHFKTESVEHDIRVAEVFLRLEKLNCFRNYLSENLLQSSSALEEDPEFKAFANLQSDAALVIESINGKLQTYAIEVELSCKSPSRYREKLLNYYLASEVDSVLYITPKQGIQQLIVRIDNEVRSGQTPKVYFCREESVTDEALNVTFQNAQGANIELR